MIFKKLALILEGWFKLVFYKNREESSKRWKICQECLFLNKQFDTCILCGCYMPAKIKCKFKKNSRGKSYFIYKGEMWPACEIEKW